jgi:serine/threonine protein kinase
VLDAGSQQGEREFNAEAIILSGLHHPHILLLVGTCSEPPHFYALVYELMEGGSLEQALGLDRGPAAETGGTMTGLLLPWHERVRVAAEVAAALSFLHSAEPPIVHMDVKPANVLLGRWVFPLVRASHRQIGLVYVQ